MQKPARPVGQEEDVRNRDRGMRMRRKMRKRVGMKPATHGMMMKHRLVGMGMMMRRRVAKGMMMMKHRLVGMMMHRRVAKGMMMKRHRLVEGQWKLVKNRGGDCECTEDPRGRLVLSHHATFKDCEDEQKRC